MCPIGGSEEKRIRILTDTDSFFSGVYGCDTISAVDGCEEWFGGICVCCRGSCRETRIVTVRAVRVFYVAGERSGVRGRRIRRRECRR